MRCTRCDKLAIPQAVGLTDDGKVVFGWCLDCLEEAGCTEIEVASRSRRPPGRLILRARGLLSRVRARARRRARSRALERVETTRPAAFDPWHQRRQLVAAVSSSLGLWGLVLGATGLFLYWTQRGAVHSPMGNGTPALLIGGGGAAAIVGLALWAFSLEVRVPGARHVWKLIQAAGLLVAGGVLANGLLYPLPRRDRAIAAISTLGLAVALTARMIELHRERRLAAQSGTAS